MRYALLLLVCVMYIQPGWNKKHALFKSLPLYVRFQYAGLCDDSPPGITLHNLTFHYNRSKATLSGVWKIDKSFNIDKVLLKIRRCHDAQAEHNCEQGQTFAFGKEACTMMNQKGMVWSGFIEAFHPPLKCPVEKGQYHINNATVDTAIAEKLFGNILEKYFWRIRVDVFDVPKRFVACVVTGVQFTRGRA